MIYIGLIRMFWLVSVVAGCAAIAAGFLKREGIRRFLIGGLVGSFVGCLLAPLIGVSVGLVPSPMIEPQYLVRPFYGCIAPGALAVACIVSASGFPLGFAVGGYISFRRGNRA
jgi:hypothetical protein